MPDQTVKVTFNPPNSWTFDPDPVRMSAAGKVVLHRDPGNADWTFQGASVKDGGGQFQSRVNPGGQHADIQDDHTSMGSFEYTVTVQDGSGTYTSPDPTIINVQPPLKQ